MLKTLGTIALAAVLFGCSSTDPGLIVKPAPVPPPAPLLQCDPIRLAPQIAK